MSYYTDWFLAADTEAEAIASLTTTEEHSFDDWPHLSLKGIGEMAMTSLWGILRGEPESLDSPTGDLLFQEADEVFVCRVEPGFIDSLAAIKPKAIKTLLSEWHKSEELADWEAAEVDGVLRELVKFARQSQREGKPVLQLSVV